MFWGRVEWNLIRGSLVGVPVMRRLLDDEDFSRRLGELAEQVLIAAPDAEATVSDKEAEIDSLIAAAIPVAGIGPS